VQYLKRILPLEMREISSNLQLVVLETLHFHKITDKTFELFASFRLPSPSDAFKMAFSGVRSSTK